ncbi:pyruvate dehydrogenase complex dihydrolipoamide acetyltransferase [Rhodospirillaceae bacterium SYSU D60014]|uniref:pyruvate dehydrogenase complex dihydrolipoamide acetyltransferase n=1 Tax=Virgifigura deserti TaxID=2268457 RepID=UPI000E67642B
MPIKVLMPALSPTMTEGNLAKWHKQEGDAVQPGDVIAEIETDKATMEVEAVDEGKLGKILVPEGSEGVKVNAVIALLLEEGEEESALKDGGGVAAPVETPKAAPPEEPKPSPEPAKAEAPAPAPAPAKAGAPESAPAPRHDGEDRVFASPLARRMAAQAGLDLTGVTGSGPNGRIVKTDIDAALSRPETRAEARPEPAPAEAPAAAREAGLPAFTEQPNSNMRKVIARRLSEAKREAPHFYLTIDCEIDALLKIRQDLNGRADGKYKLSVNDFVIRASALALRQVPAANASWTEAAIRLYQSADISVAVAIPNGLITPVVRNADAKGLAEIANEMKDLAGRAREGKLKPEEYQGGTFSVSNLGMYGIREFSAVINPPQGAILAVGAGEQRPIVRDGSLAVATVMSCTLSVDHRVVDGATGAEFLAAFKRLIEDPLTMLL